jgi:nitrite reductase (NADH) small subunit
MIAAPSTSLGSFVVNLGSLAKIPRGEGRRFQVGRASIAVFHTRTGGVFATDPACPHKQGPLADGIIGDHKVICPLHAYIFDLSDGRPVGNSCQALQTYPATVNEDGEILVDVEKVLALR